MYWEDGTDVLSSAGIEPVSSSWQDSALPTSPPGPPWAQALIFLSLNCSRDDKIKIWFCHTISKNPPRNNNEFRYEHELYHPKWKTKSNDWDHSRNVNKIRRHGRKDWQNCNLLYSTWMYDDFNTSNVAVDRLSTTQKNRTVKVNRKQTCQWKSVPRY